MDITVCGRYDPLLIDGERSLRICMDILGEYHLLSGLKINIDKIKVIKFGRKRDTAEPYSIQI